MREEVCMVPLTELWLPILVAAVLVFITSNILHMVLGFWHRGDYTKASSEKAILDAITPLPPGQYVVPLHDYKAMTPEQRQAAMAGPNAMILLRNPAPSFGKTLGLWFLHCLIVSFFVGYLTGRVVGPGADYLAVHRIAGTSAVMAWALGPMTESIWFGRPWRISIKHAIDGVIYGLVTGGTFGWLWP
jgi:hypothetical protein